MTKITNFNNFNYRFLYVSEALTSVKKEVESLFETHIEEGTPDETSETQDVKLLSQISSLPLSSRKEQFILLSPFQISTILDTLHLRRLHTSLSLLMSTT